MQNPTILNNTPSDGIMRPPDPPLIKPRVWQCSRDVAQQEAFAQREMTGHVYADIKNFFEVLFPVSKQDCLDVLGHLQDMGLWVAKSSDDDVTVGAWTKLPLRPSFEDRLYKSFVNIANAVSKFEGPRQYTTDGDKGILHWLDCHAGASQPRLSEEDAKRIPDIITRLVRCEETTSSGHYQAMPSTNLTWQQPVVLGEFEELNNLKSTLLRLLLHARATFKHQPDRRFLFGFIFTGEYLQVWHFDRAGSLGSRQIDVHTEPLLFVQFLLGISRKSATELGFDTSFKMRLGNTLVNSYAVEMLCDATQGDILWEFETLGEGNEGKEKFVVFRFLSENRCEVVRGRGTRVMLLWLASEVDNGVPEAERKVYVGKDVWRDVRRPAEGESYLSQGPIEGVAKFYSFEDLTIEGVSDSTASTWDRFSLDDAKVMELTSDTRTIRKHGYYPTTVKEVDASLIFARQHCRLVLKTFGLPITQFQSLEELVQVLVDAIRGHKNLVDKGFLHRDISRGNIVIARDQNSGDWRGILIDQDYAAPIDHTPLVGDYGIGTSAFMAIEMLIQKPVIRPPSMDRKVSSAVNESTTHSQKKTKALIPHRPIHDIESFFWLLCWICMSRRGPCTPRGDLSSETAVMQSPDKNAAEEDEIALSAVDRLFNCPMEICGVRKRDVLIWVEDYEADVEQHLAPYFRPLQACLFSLRRLLYNAYQSKQDDDIHEQFLEVLESAVGGLKDSPPGSVPYQAEMEGRAKRLREFYDTPRLLFPPPRPDYPLVVDIDGVDGQDPESLPTKA